MGPIAGGRMANPIAHEVDMLLGDVGEVVGEVPVDDGEDEPAMETVQPREAGCDASRRPLDGASGLAARSVKMSRLVRSRRWRDGHGSLPSQAQQPAEFLR